jgi:nucleoside-triphosphatase
VGRALLFTGQPRVGKTTAVREVVSAVGPASFSGFVSDESRVGGQRTGFSIVMLDGRVGSLASIDSPSALRVESVTRLGKVSYGIDLCFLEDTALSAMRTRLLKNPGEIVVIDEIGPMQLHSEAFRNFILEVLGQDGAVLFGTIVLRSVAWADELKERTGVETFLLTPQNRQTLTEMMASYLATTTGRPGVPLEGSH